MNGYRVLLALSWLALSSTALAAIDTPEPFEVSGPVDLGECSPGNYSGAVDTFEQRRCAQLVILRVHDLIDEVLQAHYEHGLRITEASCDLLPSELKALLPLSNRVAQELNKKKPRPEAPSRNDRFNLRDCPIAL